MIIVKKIENDKNFAQCTGCGEVEDTYTHIKVNDIVEGTEKNLTLCSNCKTTLIRELLSSKNPDDFKNVKFVLENQISVLRTDLKCIEERWKCKFGLPFTKERILEHKKSAISIAYLNFTRMIEDCERILKVISVE